MNNKTPLYISNEALSDDPALKRGGRGARKICVTTLYDSKEHRYKHSKWHAGESSTPVMVLSDTELAVFSDQTVQDRHYHKQAYEFYTVLDGTFLIEIEEECFTLSRGETIVVPPDAIHEVLRETLFTAQVITTNCNGLEDKFVVSREVK